MTVNVLPEIKDVLPHRDEMLLLEAIESCDEHGIKVRTVPQSEGWYADVQGNMPAWIGIELMAQAIAAWVGVTARFEDRAVKQGVLLGTRSYVAEQAFFLAGVTLDITAAPIYRDDSGMGAFKCEIWQLGVCVAAATLNVFEPEDFEVFLQQRSQ